MTLLVFSEGSKKAILTTQATLKWESKLFNFLFSEFNTAPCSPMSCQMRSQHHTTPHHIKRFCILRLAGCLSNLFNRYYYNLRVTIYPSNFSTRSILPTAWSASLNTYLFRLFCKKFSSLKILGISVPVWNSANWSSMTK